MKHFPTSYLDDKSADLSIYLGGYDAEGNTHGEAYSYRYGRHAWAQMVKDWYAGGWTYDGSPHGRRVTTIHELGHFFGADHEGSDDYMQAYDWRSGLDHYYTVMWSTNKGSASKYEFSSDDYNGDSTHDNARRIRETKGVVANYNIGGDGTPWNPWDDDCVIENFEISLAEYHWATNTPVNGYIITNSEISMLEYQWATGDVC